MVTIWTDLFWNKILISFSNNQDSGKVKSGFYLFDSCKRAFVFIIDLYMMKELIFILWFSIVSPIYTVENQYIQTFVDIRTEIELWRYVSRFLVESEFNFYVFATTQTHTHTHTHTTFVVSHENTCICFIILNRVFETLA